MRDAIAEKIEVIEEQNRDLDQRVSEPNSSKLHSKNAESAHQRAKPKLLPVFATSAHFNQRWCQQRTPRDQLSNSIAQVVKTSNLPEELQHMDQFPATDPSGKKIPVFHQLGVLRAQFDHRTLRQSK